ncbi:MAG: hypothetical protein ABJB66_10695 [Gemmatimonadaceae bacterium]
MANLDFTVNNGNVFAHVVANCLAEHYYNAHVQQTAKLTGTVAADDSIAWSISIGASCCANWLTEGANYFTDFVSNSPGTTPVTVRNLRGNECHLQSKSDGVACGIPGTICLQTQYSGAMPPPDRIRFRLCR